MVFDLQLGANQSATSKKTINLARNQWEYLLKTSIDFVVCDTQDKPLLCVEYDGLQEGFSSGRSYIPTKESEDKNRTWKMELKLEVADTFDFLYVVLGSRHFDDIGQEEKISIADTIIGEWLVYQALIDEASKNFSPQKLGLSSSQYNSLSIQEQNTYKFLWTKYEWLTPERIMEKLQKISPLQQMLAQAWLGIENLDLVTISCFVYHKESRKIQPFSCGHPMFDDRDFGDALLYGEKREIFHQNYHIEAEAWIPVFKLSDFWGFEVVLRDLVSFLAMTKLRKAMSS
jgi:hypothetical protein